MSKVLALFICFCLNLRAIGHNAIVQMDKLLQSHFLGLYCMVLADGIIDAKELETLYRIGVENYGLTPEEITESIKESGTSFIEPQTLEGKIELLYNMCQIALADGVIDDAEVNLLKKYIIKMGFDSGNVDIISAYLFDWVMAKKTIPEIINLIK